jgi:hypothetical protein
MKTLLAAFGGLTGLFAVANTFTALGFLVAPPGGKLAGLISVGVYAAAAWFGYQAARALIEVRPDAARLTYSYATVWYAASVIGALSKGTFGIWTALGVPLYLVPLWFLFTYGCREVLATGPHYRLSPQDMLPQRPHGMVPGTRRLITGGVLLGAALLVHGLYVSPATQQFNALSGSFFGAVAMMDPRAQEALRGLALIRTAVWLVGLAAVGLVLSGGFSRMRPSGVPMLGRQRLGQVGLLAHEPEREDGGATHVGATSGAQLRTD